MSIGEALAQARDQAGLSIAQVSQLTRIRETIIRGIESDDYSACGGDFYARGHIRAIARAVGTDPEPLIEDYDAVRGGPPGVTWAEIANPDPPGRTGKRHRPRWTMGLLGLALVVALGFTGYHFASGSGRSVRGTPTSGSHVVKSGRSPGASPKTTGSAGPYAHKAVVRLTALRRCWAKVTTPGGKRLSRITLARGASRQWTFQHPVDLVLSDPGAVRLTVDGKNPLPAGTAARPVTLSIGPGRSATVIAQPRPASSTRTLTPVSAAAFGPGGQGQGDNPQLASLAIDGQRGTAWHTDWYTSARFGNLYPGTGLLLDMGHPVTITRARVTLGSARGAAFQLRVGSVPSLAHLRTVVRRGHAHGAVNLRLTGAVRGRYVLIWFTVLPRDPAGTFQASVHDVTMKGRG